MSEKDDIVIMAKIMQDAMKDYIIANPEGKAEDVYKVGVGAVLKWGKGKFNPSMLMDIARLERSVFEKYGTKYMLQC